MGRERIQSQALIAIPPGASIREQLQERGMSQKEFAARMDLSEKHISKLINGDVQLTPEVAAGLEMVLGVPAGFWNNLESIYREKLVQIKLEKEAEEDAVIAEQIPYHGMVEFEWIPAATNTWEKIRHLRQYFEVTHLSLINHNQVGRIACRQLSVYEQTDLALIIWTQWARILARKLHLSAFDRRAFLHSLEAIHILATQDLRENKERLTHILADCGIALILLPYFESTSLRGATFREGHMIVICLNPTWDSAEQFGFALYHELAHIVLGHIDQKQGTSESDEIEADRWAQSSISAIQPLL